MFNATIATPPKNSAHPASRRKSVLVVDDSGMSRMMMCSSLMREGILVRTAKSATEALASIEQVRPQLLLTDVHMPQADGFELLDRVRELDPELPVVMISGDGDPGLRLRASERGAAGIVAKSDGMGELVDLICKQLA